MTSDTNNVDSLFAAVVAAFAHDRAVTRKRRFALENVLSVGGKIFAMLVGGQFVVKLPRARVDALVSTGSGKKFEPAKGRVMNEWIAIESVDAAWISLAKEAYLFSKR
jgi:hypothetical protein